MSTSTVTETPAPLHASANSPLTEGGQPGWLVTPSGKLRYATWSTTMNGLPRGTILLAHGLSEQIEKYHPTIAALIHRGFAVAMLDWRGHGLSDNCPAASKEDFSVHDADLASFMETVVLDKMPQPVIGMGHSFGGCLICCAVHDHPDWFAGGILSSPMLGINLMVKWPFLGLVAEIISAIRPAGLVRNVANRKAARFTSDQRRFDLHQELLGAYPQLKPKYDILFWFKSATRRLRQMRSTGWYQAISKPMLVCISDSENVVDNDASKRAVQNMPQAKLVEIDKAWHEILLESEDIQKPWWENVDEFLEKLAPSKTLATTTSQKQKGMSREEPARGLEQN